MKVLNIILPEEKSPGFKIVEMANWPGKVFVVPRVNLKDLKDRPEINNPALYFLFGDSDDVSTQKLYVGETESFFNRLTNHDTNKDFWNLAIIFIGGIDKAKVKYLEYLAVKKAKEISRFSIENSTTPKKPHLAEFDEIAVVDYFQTVKYLVSVLGYAVFEDVQKNMTDNKGYYLKADGVLATANVLENGEIFVAKGSTARIHETDSFTGWSKSARAQFLQEGKIKIKDEESYELTQDIIFKSPSAAAATLMGRPANGWTAWKDEQGNTLDDNLRK